MTGHHIRGQSTSRAGLKMMIAAAINRCSRSHSLKRLFPNPSSSRSQQLPTGTLLSRIFSRQLVSKEEDLKFENIEVETKGHIRIISINRPEKRNCVNKETASELYEAFKAFDSADPDSVRVGVLQGRGGTFCSGYDLTEVATAGSAESVLLPFGQGHAPMGPTRTLLSKPVVAAVTGYAVAGGLELALFCDLRVAEEDVTFGVFCRRFGVPLMDGGTVRLPALIGYSRAMDMILTGRPVGAQEALQMGLANRIVPKGKALEEALKLANQIAAFPQDCLRTDRKSAHNATFNKYSLLGALSCEHKNGVMVLRGAQEGAKKFTEGEGRGGTFKQQ